MRVLLAHNRYQYAGGEDSAVAAEMAQLREHGHEVATYFRHYEELKNLNPADLALQSIWSRRTIAEVSDFITSFSPDILHVHNTVPLISPSIYAAAERFQLPVVQTLHNHRLFCLQGSLSRAGQFCERCVGHLPWQGIVHRCYRGSLAQSIGLATVLTLHRARGTYIHQVHKYIALSQFSRSKLLAGGLPGDKIVVLPNFVNAEANEYSDSERSGFLFVGRLSLDKGTAILAQALRIDGQAASLTVIGSGPEDGGLFALPNIQVRGALPNIEVRAAMRRATALVIPSLAQEVCPITVLEAFASGTPVIASDAGSLAELIEHGVTGLITRSGDAQDLADKLRWARQHPQAMATMGQAAFQCYVRHYSSLSNYRQRMAIFAAAMDAAKLNQ